MTPRELPLADVTGIVLAGGRSSRFGSDKLAAVLDGRPVLHHALAAAASVTERIVLVVAPTVAPALPVDIEGRIQVVRDPEAFGGPLVGLRAALGQVRTPRAIVVGGDMPRLVPAVLRLLAIAAGPRHPAVVLEVPGAVQPLPLAIEVPAARAAADLVLARGGRSLRDLIEALGATSVPATDWLALDPASATVSDIDRPSDLGG